MFCCTLVDGVVSFILWKGVYFGCICIRHTHSYIRNIWGKDLLPFTTLNYTIPINIGKDF